MDKFWYKPVLPHGIKVIKYLTNRQEIFWGFLEYSLSITIEHIMKGSFTLGNISFNLAKACS